jgi:four helix bundle protein
MGLGDRNNEAADSDVKKIRTYRDLIAWQRAMSLAKAVYRVTGRMPDSERFGLTNQMRRASVSVPSNIAEGYARQSTADYLKFLRIARGSLAEVSTQYEIAISLDMLGSDAEVSGLLAETDRVLQGLIQSLGRHG